MYVPYTNPYNVWPIMQNGPFRIMAILQMMDLSNETGLTPRGGDSGPTLVISARWLSGSIRRSVGQRGFIPKWPHTIYYVVWILFNHEALGGFHMVPCQCCHLAPLKSAHASDGNISSSQTRHVSSNTTNSWNECHAIYWLCPIQKQDLYINAYMFHKSSGRGNGSCFLHTNRYRYRVWLSVRI